MCDKLFLTFCNISNKNMSEKKKDPGQKRRWSFILWEKGDIKLDEDTRVTFIEALKVCKHWCFQLERGTESQDLHFQGRMSFDQPKRKSEALKLFPEFPTLSLKLEHEEEASSFYVMKERTRVAGPWSDKDKKQYIPRQVREVEKLKPWQQHIVDDKDVWNKRTINIVYDTQGNIGKSTLVAWIRAYGIGVKLPFVNDYKDIMRMVMDIPKARLYIIDLPRAINKEKLYQMYAAIETIKDGYAYDDRYHFKDEIFDCPNIWVFTNKLPDPKFMSMDRWIFWEVQDEQLIQRKFEEFDVFDIPGAAL